MWSSLGLMEEQPSDWAPAPSQPFTVLAITVHAGAQEQ